MYFFMIYHIQKPNVFILLFLFVSINSTRYQRKTFPGRECAELDVFIIHCVVTHAKASNMDIVGILSTLNGQMRRQNQGLKKLCVIKILFNRRLLEISSELTFMAYSRDNKRTPRFGTQRIQKCSM